jgi:hypothetical protein
MERAMSRKHNLTVDALFYIFVENITTFELVFPYFVNHNEVTNTYCIYVISYSDSFGVKANSLRGNNNFT